MDQRTYARLQARQLQKVRQRQILSFAVPTLLIILALLLVFPRKGVVNAAQLDQPTPQEMSRAPQPVTPQSVTPVATAPLNTLPLNEITPDLVAEVQSGTTPIIEFRDGSRRTLAPYEVQQLPGEIRIRLEYSRE